MRINWIIGIVFLVFALGVVVFSYLFSWISIFDRTPPTIELEGIPPGVGLMSPDGYIRLQDAESGLYKVMVSVSREGKKVELLRKEFRRQVTGQQEVAVPLPGKKSGLTMGEGTLFVSACDRSIWNNCSFVAKLLQVDYAKPLVKLFFAPDSLHCGGSGVVTYRAFDAFLIKHGVTAWNKFFRGQPLSKWLDQQPNSQDGFISLFSTPFACETSNDGAFEVFAADFVGNKAAVSVNVDGIAQKGFTTDVRLSKADFEEILQNAKDAVDAAEVAQHCLEDQLAASHPRYMPDTTEQAIFCYQQFSEKHIQALLKAVGSQPRLWQEPFIQPLDASIVANFGEDRRLSVDSTVTGLIRQRGVEFESFEEPKVVRASNNGRIVFAGNLPIYGNTLILDHGTGLATLYSRMSSIDHTEGEFVSRSDRLGTTASKEINYMNNFLFEVRVGGQPVRPSDWWSEEWVRENILAPLHAFEKLGT